MMSFEQVASCDISVNGLVQMELVVYEYLALGFASQLGGVCGVLLGQMLCLKCGFAKWQLEGKPTFSLKHIICKIKIKNKTSPQAKHYEPSLLLLFTVLAFITAQMITFIIK